MREDLNKYKSGMMNKEDGEDEGITADDAEGAGGQSESDGEVKPTTKRVNGTVDPEVMELRRQVSNTIGIQVPNVRIPKHLNSGFFVSGIQMVDVSSDLSDHLNTNTIFRSSVLFCKYQTLRHYSKIALLDLTIVHT